MPHRFTDILTPATIVLGVLSVTMLCCARPNCPDACSSKDAAVSPSGTRAVKTVECAAIPKPPAIQDETPNAKTNDGADASLDSDAEFDASQIQPPVFSNNAEATQMKKLNYAVGYDVGRNLKRNDTALLVNSFLHGVVDGMGTDENGDSAFMSSNERIEVKREHATKLREKERAENEKKAVLHQKMATAFLNENRQRKDVVETKSGLQYRILKKGKGKRPGADSRVTVHYRGYLLTGEEFDSSHKRNTPATFGVSRVVKGWTEALQLMRKGAKWEIFIPADLGYGVRGAGSKIPPGALLVFEIELLDILPKK